MSKQVANTILSQLGGGRFIDMTGAHSFFYDKSEIGPYLLFKIPKAKQGIKAVKITLNGLDLYNVEFIKQKRAPSHEVSTVAKHDDVYLDSLEQIFTKETGLYTRLF